MSATGVLKNVTVIDQSGNPVTVELRDGRFMLDVTIREERRLLEQILLELRAVEPNDPARAVKIAGEDVMGQLRPIRVATDGSLQVFPESLTDTVTLDALNAALVIRLQGQTAVTFNVIAQSGTWGSVFEVSADGGQTWAQLQGLQYFFGVGTFTSGPSGQTGAYTIPTAGYNVARLRINSFTSGGPTLSARATGGAQSIVIGGTLPGGGNKIGTVSLTNDAQNKYACALASGALAGVGANGTVFSFRYTGAGLAIIQKVRLGVEVTTAFTAAQLIEFALVVARAFTASDSLGTAATLTGNNAKKRSSSASTGVGDIRISSTAALTAGTRTLDAQPFVVDGLYSAGLVSGAAPELIDFTDGRIDGELVCATNEGFVITMPTAMGAAGVIRLWVSVAWSEVTTW